jgi:hypothetical protein
MGESKLADTERNSKFPLFESSPWHWYPLWNILWFFLSSFCQIPVHYLKYWYSTSNTGTVPQIPVQYLKYWYSTSNAGTVPQIPVQYLKYRYCISNTGTVPQIPVQYLKYYNRFLSKKIAVNYSITILLFLAILATARVLLLLSFPNLRPYTAWGFEGFRSDVDDLSVLLRWEAASHRRRTENVACSIISLQFQYT